ncbi:MAG TPA: gluconate 2-dehydrogenase subunit 3 family protein [Caulobacteraceae bacterium]|jgi:hypothetical protein|nr:gluconate 2-dehydrogenase subunit 3 family protein [Caulobacteraceae bacterium]
MAELYPGYDVMAKARTPSWNEQTRRVVEARLAIDPEHHRFFTDAEWLTMKAVCDRIVPQDRAHPVPLAAMVDGKLADGEGDGYRNASLPPQADAWRRGLAALEAEARARHGRCFHALEAAERNALLTAMQQGLLAGQAWAGMPSALFFSARVLPDIVAAYYAHPLAWNEIGFGGPASPRGYVRMDFDRRDPWEAAEARPGHEAQAQRMNARVGRT